MRIKVFVWILLLCLVYLVSGLVYHQIFRHDTYKNLSENNRLRVMPLMAPRGSIFDKTGKVMAKDVLSFNASIVYNQVKDKIALKSALSRILGIEEALLEKNIYKCRRMPYSTLSVVSDIGTKAAIQLEEIVSDYPGLYVQVTTKRKYIDGTASSAILGYLGLINRAEFKRLKHYGYSITDLMGRSGIEKKYDDYLRGVYGGKQIEVDNMGREIATLGYREPVPGKNISLTIDLDLQRFCHAQMAGHRGAIVVMEPASGAIIAMVSAPSYDPEVFIDRKRSKEVRSLLRDPGSPLLNRAISGVYPSGSVFKLVTAAGALERNKVTFATSFTCEGAMKLGRARFRCWKEQGHGPQHIKEAIKNSCNVYFYRLGLLLGVEGIYETAKEFGYSEKTGIDLPSESSGFLPSRKWKKRRFKDNWYDGETLNFSIGQGYLLTTPLQVARMFSVFANKGYLVKPYLVKDISGVEMVYPESKWMEISSSSIEIVREGMMKCVNDRRGTGMKAKLDEMIVSGKTGTAQTSKKKNHGWFGGFAPFDDPQLTIVVFDEFGGKGGYFPAMTAGKIFKEAKRLGIIMNSDR